MCDQEHARRSASAERVLAASTRREFAIGATGLLAGCAFSPTTANQPALAEDWVTISTPHGAMDAFFVRPSRGRFPAVVTWPDILGVRGAYLTVARRLAAQGYAVILNNHYYRQAPSLQFDKGWDDFLSQGGFSKIRPWIAELTWDAISSDAVASINWLDQRPEVDGGKGIGTHGYCLGGRFAVWTAAAAPARVRAAASMHGWALVKPEEAQSPHKMLDRSRANYLFAIGQNDDKASPEEKDILRQAAVAAGRPAEIEVYPAEHGWMLTDSDVYDEAAAERGWQRLQALFGTL